jgi:hypothetical protein
VRVRSAIGSLVGTKATGEIWCAAACSSLSASEGTSVPGALRSGVVKGWQPSAGSMKLLSSPLSLALLKVALTGSVARLVALSWAVRPSDRAR